MRVLAVVLALAVSAPAAMTYAQTPASAPSTQGKPAPTAPATPRPQGQTSPGPPQPATAPAELPPPFQDGFKYGFIRFQLVASASADGRKAAGEITQLQDQRQREITEKDKALQTLQDRLQSQGAVLSDASRIQLQNDIDRQQREIQRMVEDAKLDVEKLTGQLQQNFMLRLNPIIERLAKEKQIHMIFNANESGLVWAQPGMDLTGDVIRALDGAAAPGGAAKPAAAAPATTPSSTPPAAPGSPLPAAPAPATQK